MNKFALKVPAVRGVKLRLNVHEECGGTLPAHVSVWLK
jgi:hypothetical protein